MRHVPPLEYIREKVDNELRIKVRILAEGAFEGEYDRHLLDAVEPQLKAICTALDRITECAAQTRAPSHGSSSLAVRLQHAFTTAVDALARLDPAEFRKRPPLNSFTRSRGETIHAYLLMIIGHVRSLTDLIGRKRPDVLRQLIESFYPVIELPTPEDIAGNRDSAAPPAAAPAAP